MQKKRIFIPEINKFLNIKVSAQGMRTMKKNGAYATLLKAGLLKAR
jgi:large subunit ribosomal protein L28